MADDEVIQEENNNIPEENNKLKEEEEEEERELDSEEESEEEDGEEGNGENNGKEKESFHPLESEWTFWYDKRQATGKRMKGEKENYESNLRAIGTCRTVEEFWRYYNHLVKPSKLELNSNYHFFKHGIKPMWEDSANLKGGKWILNFKDKSILDVCWENIILGLVGETLDVDDEITGAVISRRKAGDRIAVWNRSKDNEQAIMNIGQRLKTFMGVDLHKVIVSGYQNHEDSMTTGSSYSNPTHYKL